MQTKKTTIMALALAVMGLSSCGKQSADEAAAGSTTEEKAALRIAYVEIDTLMANYQLCKDFTAIGNMEGENITRTLAAKQRTLEQHYSAMQQKYESNGFTSQEELQRAQASLQKEQQELESLNTRLYSSFQEQQAKYNEEMRDSINAFIKSYNKKKKFDLILSKAGDNMLYANPAFDITDEVLKGLNKRYRPSAEVTEKLKQVNEKEDKE